MDLIKLEDIRKTYRRGEMDVPVPKVRRWQPRRRGAGPCLPWFFAAGVPMPARPTLKLLWRSRLLLSARSYPLARYRFTFSIRTGTGGCEEK